ncbi:NAD(P)-binding Rossmann-fold superfamily protein [Raphanus sativus]|uniref:Short-chain dehydrogenase TIC 32 B, chloroplastic n=1 Tax=Raphanus sativus TaxID=3726 RepID=A0A6J0JPF3_RAPSA|nr:short-chain dehydrogenase TIC 32 B, chloroplastic [Raphanus sativus]KAJ4891836.1 NAD(P)-binding Rossmann-fold superfamily protein [Raphanus sativus]
MEIYGMVTGKAGKSGFGSASTAEDVTHSIDAKHLTAIITGGTSGIGLEAARVLGMRGAHVIIAARNAKAANESKEMILQTNPNARINYLQLDLSSIKSIRSFVHEFLALNLSLNILINNAGVMFCPFQLTEDGIESQFATNHIGHFLLTNLLLDKMKSSSKESGVEGRIVNLSSIAHTYTYTEGIMFDYINDPDRYSDKKAYGQSKLANLLHSNALSRKLQEEDVNITINSVHPGLVTTNLFRHSGLGMSVFKAMSFFLWKNIPQGAATTCYVALHPDLKGVTGKYFADCNVTTTSNFATDISLADKLWDFSTKLIDSLH